MWVCMDCVRHMRGLRLFAPQYQRQHRQPNAGTMSLRTAANVLITVPLVKMVCEGGLRQACISFIGAQASGYCKIKLEAGYRPAPGRAAVNWRGFG